MKVILLTDQHGRQFAADFSTAFPDAVRAEVADIEAGDFDLPKGGPVTFPRFLTFRRVMRLCDCGATIELDELSCSPCRHEANVGATL